MGQRLIPLLIAWGHQVRALVRPGSERRLVAGAELVIGDALDAATYAQHVSGTETFVHLVGTPHPNPAKARQFEQVDLVSVREAVAAARRAGVGHFVYVSVAQPAPVMRAYIAVRQRGEQFIRESGMNATILRPWYVLGPGRRWPLVLAPAYALLRRLPSTAEAARRLGLVNDEQMLAALLRAVEQPPAGVRIVEVPEIAASRLLSAPTVQP
jgi:uncharacterized protein YbjT (DUF2867 family)